VIAWDWLQYSVEYDVTFFVCGDGVKDVGEECDDWNDKNGDGCDSQSQIEDCWSCQRGIFSVRKVRSSLLRAFAVLCALQLRWYRNMHAFEYVRVCHWIFWQKLQHNLVGH
jgi:cysteine-rich repeat protein